MMLLKKESGKNYAASPIDGAAWCVLPQGI
jgi:hypothetical protein